jgi:hypothetical protein
MERSRSRRTSIAVLLLASLPASAQRRAVAPVTAIDLEPFSSKRGERPEIVPVLAGDKVLLSTTLRLLAFDASTGQLAWSAGPPPGWEALEPRAREELFGGFDLERLLVLPASGQGVAVAALQIPSCRTPMVEWQGLQIQRCIPERRLFAFEVATGRPLWSHAPPAGRDGSDASFPERMRVAGPPLAAGSRVLVPCTSDDSSVDYHVACYQLETGALLWSTFVTRGQLECNMFGYLPSEFAAAPLVHASEQVGAAGLVLVQTDLGCAAALDLVSGTLLWKTAYTPIPLPKARSYSPPVRKSVWRAAPPVVVGDVVLAASRDSTQLLAFDLRDGHLLWAADEDALRRLDPATRDVGFDHLIGADSTTIYLGGDKLSALAKPHGLGARAPVAPAWTVPTPREKRLARERLAGDTILVPGPSECRAFDRSCGQLAGTFGAPAARGLLATEDALFALAGNALRRIER